MGRVMFAGSGIFRNTPRCRAAAIILVGCGLAVALGGGLVAWPLIGDCQPHGRLTYQGSPATVGTRLVAQISSFVVAETMVTVGGQYALSIPPDDPQTTAREGWNTDDQISIWVGGYQGHPTFTAFDGSREIDLTVSSITLDVRKSTWGKIKALFR